jgi:hypothetical protein
MMPLTPDSNVDPDLFHLILNLMRQMENDELRPIHALDCPYIQCRKVLVGWMIEVCEALKFGGVTTFHSCYLMDRVFLSEVLNQTSRRQSFQLVAMVCILIAAKFGEADNKIPSMADLNEMSANSYSVELFRKVETSVLNFLNWKVNCITPLCFVKYFLFNTSTGTFQLDEEIHRFVILLLGLALQDHEFIVYVPSKLCAAAIFCARTILSESSGRACACVPWTNEMENAFEYTASELATCHAHLFLRYHEFVQRRCPPTVQPTNMDTDESDDINDELLQLDEPAPETPTCDCAS